MSKNMDRETKYLDCGSPVSSSNAVHHDNVASQVQHPPPLCLDKEVPSIEDLCPPFEKYEKIELPVDIVQVVVKDDELLNCSVYLENLCRSTVPRVGKVYFGEITSEDGNKVKVALLRCGESSGTAGGSQNVALNAIDYLKPKAIICTGFCGCINPDRAKLGDVVISTTLATYEHKKVGKDGEEDRNKRVDVSRNMGYRIRSAADGWKAPIDRKRSNYKVKVHTDRGMLSGPELVNNDKRRKQLLDKFPMAVGIEMEGEGISFVILSYTVYQTVRL